ncbi:metalloprotease PmbA [Marinihelvus fidelis]|uniref:Metalloprotease PmbA n=1 Tax=Marinihelvus fidelis TaxID=2613842 RepID=A0A5N0TA91_9GAMM|nr:metalloprotease PmbA [Marinihelvus fidelis]KAA9130249.1 metalloprotease PmbA [Marinihelvus fidelis]
MSEVTSVAQADADRKAGFEELEARIQDALRRATRAGVDGAEATASIHGGLSVNVRLGEVETIEHTRDRGISITVYADGRKGHASSADLEPESVLACVDRAVEIARFTEADNCNGLADPERMATEFPDLDLWHHHDLDAQAAIDRALAIEEAGRADPGITNSEGGSVSSSFGQSVYGNSNGFMGQASGTRYSQSCVLVGGKGEGMQRDYWYDSTRSFDDLESPEFTGQEAARRTLRRLDARRVPTAKVPVAFAPEVARSLVGHFTGAIAGSALYRNASFLKDAVGEQLFPDWLTLSERPFLPRAAGSATFDAEGVAPSDRDIIDAGVLTGYILSSYSARRLGLESTGNAGGVHNLRLTGAGGTQADLLADIGTGLLVTEVMGQGVNMVTGNYSRGASGFWIENGEIAFPVEEVTVAGNLRDMFMNIRAIGEDVDRRGNVHIGTVVVDGMTLAGE